jgi:hypothetical protein
MISSAIRAPLENRERRERHASVREASSSNIANARTRRTIAQSRRPEAASRSSRKLNPCGLNCSRHPPPLSNRPWRIANHIPQFLRTRESGIQLVSITSRPPRLSNDITPGWNSPKTPPNFDQIGLRQIPGGSVVYRLRCANHCRRGGRRHIAGRRRHVSGAGVGG